MENGVKAEIKDSRMYIPFRALGNALGAYVGGLPLEAGLGYRYPALIAVPMSFFAFLLMVWFFRKYERLCTVTLR